MQNGLCTHESNSGFLHGLWDGVTAPITLVVSIFFKNIQFYDVCARSWWYNFAFLAGIVLSVLVGVFNPMLLFIVFAGCLVIYLIWLVFASILYILLAAVAIIFIMVLAGLYEKNVKGRILFKK